MSSPQIWNVEQEKDREKEKVGGRPAKLNEKKGRQRFRARDKKNTGDIFLLEEHVSRCSRAKQQQRNVQKKCAARAKLFFLLIRPIAVFHRSPALPSPLSITRDHILFEQTFNIIESFAFSPG